MYLVALLTLFLAGMQSGYAENRNLIAQIILVLVLSMVFLLIIDLDRSSQGLLQVPQQALINLQRQLNP
jgi:positive regulator of sigma E activity